MTDPRPPKLQEIAARIYAHLKRMEADPEINTAIQRSTMSTRKFWNPVCFPAGSKIAVTYISYQGSLMLTKAEALCYLEWLDAGNNGKHHKALEVGGGQ